MSKRTSNARAMLPGLTSPRCSTISERRGSPMRKMTYAQALSEGLCQAMERDPSIFVTGIGVDYPSGIFGSTTEAAKRFGPARVFDAPAMENALTGIVIGAAAMGKRPIIVHARNDFLFLGFDQLINLAAKWRHMFNGNAGNMPLVVRAVVGKGWGQGATHSQSTHATLAHFPGLTVVTPAFPDDAKGLMIAALQQDGPVVIVEHRALYAETILRSIAKTGHLVVADTSWELCGVASEIAALAVEKAFSDLKAPVLRIALANCPAPASAKLEQAIYPNA